MTAIIDTILADEKFQTLYQRHRGTPQKGAYGVIEQVKKGIFATLQGSTTDGEEQKYIQYIDVLLAYTKISNDQHVVKEGGITEEHPFISKKEKAHFLFEIIGLPYMHCFVGNDFLDCLCRAIVSCKTPEEKETYIQNFQEKLVYLSQFFSSFQGGNDMFHRLLRKHHVTRAHLEFLGADIASLEEKRIAAIFFGSFNEKEGRSMCNYPEASLPHMQAFGTDLLTTIDPKVILSSYARLTPELVQRLAPTGFEDMHFLHLGKLNFIPKDALLDVIKTTKEAGKPLEEGVNDYIKKNYGAYVTDQEAYRIAEVYTFGKSIDMTDKDYLSVLHAISKESYGTFNDIIKYPAMQRVLQLFGYKRFEALITAEGGDQTLYRRKGVFYYAACTVLDELSAEEVEALGGTDMLRNQDIAEKIFTAYADKISLTHAVVEQGKKVLDKTRERLTLGQIHALKAENTIQLSDEQFRAIANTRFSPEEICRIGAKNMPKLTYEELSIGSFFELREEHGEIVEEVLAK